ncbi:MAG: zinc dependent phospholipase C family protein [Clostridiales bacterium]|jgi:hypothetical protein|nr:zinc dependent phospholipase C family protein [Clostridiales bacterium]
MPAAICHYLHGERVWKALQEIKPTLSSDAFFLGAQGPDLFYFHRALPWHKKKETSLYIWGDAFHQANPAKLFQTLRQQYEQNRTPVLEAYLYGFLCHYSLDRTTHPLIQYGAATLYLLHPEKSELFLHHQIESALDTILLRYERGALPTEFPLKQAVPMNEAVWQEVSRFYQVVIAALFQKEISQDLLLEMLQDSRKVLGVLYDRTTLKKTFLARRERRKGKFRISCYFRSISEEENYDYANVCKQEWQWPLTTGHVRCETFFDLYEHSVEEAKKLIEAYFQTQDFAAFTKQIPF